MFMIVVLILGNETILDMDSFLAKLAGAYPIKCVNIPLGLEFLADCKRITINYEEVCISDGFGKFNDFSVVVLLQHACDIFTWKLMHMLLF